MILEKLISDGRYTLSDVRGEAFSEDRIADAVLETDITGITNDSRKVAADSLFFCIRGAVKDGHDFAKGALLDGASVIVVSEDFRFSEEDLQELEEKIREEDLSKRILLHTDDTRFAMAVISAHFYGDPAKEMMIIGVTGTKGKTTTTYLVRSALSNAGRNVGLIGTIEIAYNGQSVHADNTTPESIVLQRTFREMADAGVDAVVMEVSSQALKLHRTAGFVFDIGVFTNLSADHIGPNEHDSFEDYLECKSRLFRQCRKAVVNMDDPHAAQVLEGHTCDVLTYGLDKQRDLYAENAALLRNLSAPGIEFDTGGLFREHFRVLQPGRFGIYNALCAILVCAAAGIEPALIPDAVKNVTVKGRVELIPISDHFTLMIDYAHNAVALESLLTTLREYEPGRLICLFGCGGNRSRDRRFQMGEVSGRLADLTIITSDNPRNEDPMDIIADIRTGIGKTDGKHIDIPDRKEAIRYAIMNAKEGDLIVLAGKGHEDYQEIKGVKYPMDERDLIRQIREEEGI